MLQNNAGYKHKTVKSSKFIEKRFNVKIFIENFCFTPTKQYLFP
jgi:hypothetical protein